MRTRVRTRWRVSSSLAACAALTVLAVAGTGTAAADVADVASVTDAVADPVPLVAMDRWLPVGSATIGGPLSAEAATKASAASIEASGQEEPDPRPARLRIVRSAQVAQEATALPVLVVAERTAQDDWDRFAAAGFVVAHLRLPTDADGCGDLGGAADTAAMKAAVSYLVGVGPGYADRAATVDAPADFSDGRVAAVGDASGGSPYELGATGVRAVIGVDAVASEYDQRVWVDPVGSAEPDCAALARAATLAESDPWWRAREHLPRNGYHAPTLVIQDLSPTAGTAPAQARAIAGALAALHVPHQLYLVASADRRAAAGWFSAAARWLDRYLLGTPASSPMSTVVLQRDDQAAEAFETWPLADAAAASLVGAADGSLVFGLSEQELAVSGPTGRVPDRLRTAEFAADVALSGSPSVSVVVAVRAEVRLSAVGPDGSRTALARGRAEPTTSSAPVAVELSAVDTVVPAGARLELAVAGAGPGNDTPPFVEPPTLTLPVRGGPAALAAALPSAPASSAVPTPEPTTAPPTTGPPTTVSTSSAPTPATPTTTTQPATTAGPTTSTEPAPSSPGTTSTQTTEQAVEPPEGSSEPIAEEPGTADPTATPTATEPEPSDPEPTDAEPTDPEPTDPESPVDVPTEDAPTNETPIDELLPDREAASDPSTTEPVDSPRTPTLGPPAQSLPTWAERSAGPSVPTMLSMSIESGDPVNLRAVELRGVDTTVRGSLHPVRVLDPGSKAWNLVGQVSDFRSPDGTIVADNLGWRPTVATEWGESDAIEPGPAATPGAGTGLGDARVLCSGPAAHQPSIATCSGELQLGIPGTTRSGDYTALLTLTLI